MGLPFLQAQGIFGGQLLWSVWAPRRWPGTGHSVAPTGLTHSLSQQFLLPCISQFHKCCSQPMRLLATSLFLTPPSAPAHDLLLPSSAKQQLHAHLAPYNTTCLPHTVLNCCCCCSAADPAGFSGTASLPQPSCPQEQPGCCRSPSGHNLSPAAPGTKAAATA